MSHLIKIYTVKNIRRFHGKITGNQLPVHFPLFFIGARKHFQESSTVCHTALQSYKGIFEYCRLT